jgi:YbbR domain-containing protein
VLGILTHNIGWKLLSLAAAVLIWISVASEPELATLQSVPVEYKGVPDDLEISSEVRESVTLETRGPSGRLRDIAGARPAVVLDFSPVHEPGERTFDLDERTVSLPRGIQLVRVIPAQLRYTFERRTAREVPVEVRLSPPHPGYVVVSEEAIPPKLPVIGPASAVGRTTSVSTDPVDISGVISNAQYQVNTYLPEQRVRFQTHSHVTVRVVVKKK